MHPDLVIFDCDGVLVDSEPVTDAVIAANLTRHGLPLEPADVHALFVGGTVYSVAEEASSRGANLPADWPDEMYGEIYTALADSVPLYPGLIPLLDTLDAAGIAIAIASNGPRRKMEITLTPSGLWQRFAPHIHSAHDEHRPKPDPHMLLKAVREAGSVPERAVFIDDSTTGVSAGIAAGIRTFGFDPEGRRHFPGPVTRIAGHHEVAELIGLNRLA